MSTDTERTNGREVPGVDGGSEAVREQGTDSVVGAESPAEVKTEQDNEGTTFSDSAEESSPTSSGERDNGAETQQEGETANGTDRSDKPWKNRQNAQAARQRREAERRAELDRAVTQARVAATIEALDGKNPYTGEEMKDAEDVAVYLTQRKIKESGGDPVQDFAKTLAAERRQVAQEAADRAADEARQRQDVAAFRQANPGVSLEELMADADFTDYAEGKLGLRPLTEIYRGYTSMRERYRAEERDRAAQALANAQSSPGSVTGRSPAPAMTREQLLRKSYDERARFARENPDAYRVLMGR